MDFSTFCGLGPCAAALVHYGIAPEKFIIEQGVDMGRPSYIEAEVEGEKGNVRVVRIGGNAVKVLTGAMEER